MKVLLPVFWSAAVLLFSWAGVTWVPWLYCDDHESPVPDSALIVLTTALDDLVAVDSDCSGTSGAEVCFNCFPSCWSCWSCWSCTCCRRSSSSSLRGSSLSGLMVTAAEDTFLLEKDSKLFFNATFPGNSSRYVSCHTEKKFKTVFYITQIKLHLYNGIRVVCVNRYNIFAWLSK